MKKDLPHVFANPVDKSLNNTQEIYYSENKPLERSNDINFILAKINRIFSSSHHVYKSKVRITTNDGEVVKDIVGKTNGYLLTLDGENVKIIDILDIEKI